MSLAHYNEQLRHTTGSKIFWLNQINPEEIGLVVDFGCADGHILKTIRPLLPEDTLLVGIDKDPKQIAAAAQHFVDGDHFSTDWEYADHFLNDMPPGKKSILVLSSVIHEIGEEFPCWWKEEVESRRFDYVAIRDMAAPEASSGYFLFPSLVPKLPTWAETEAFRATINRYHPYEGNTLRAQLHGLLKAVHAGTDFVKREHAEHYFRWSAGELWTIAGVGAGRLFRLKTLDATTTNFFREWCAARGIFLPSYATTHVEMLLARR